MQCGRMTPVAAKAVARAVELAMRAGADQVDVSHLAAALRDSGGDELARILQSRQVEAVPQPGAAGPSAKRRLPWQRRPPLPAHAPALDALLRHAQGLSPDGQPAPRHLLAALLSSGHPAAEPFARAGITPATLLDPA